jgi:hypothetical protein
LKICCAFGTHRFCFFVLEESPWHKLYVGNPSYTVRDEDLQQSGESGAVTSAKVMMERDTGRSKKALVLSKWQRCRRQAAINGTTVVSLAAVQHHLVNARPMEARPPALAASAVAATVAVAVEIVLVGGGYGGGGGDRSWWLWRRWSFWRWWRRWDRSGGGNVAVIKLCRSSQRQKCRCKPAISPALIDTKTPVLKLYSLRDETGGFRKSFCERCSAWAEGVRVVHQEV